MYAHHSDQMSQRSQVSGVTLYCCEDCDCTRSPIELFWTAKNMFVWPICMVDRSDSYYRVFLTVSPLKEWKPR